MRRASLHAAFFLLGSSCLACSTDEEDGPWVATTCEEQPAADDLCASPGESCEYASENNGGERCTASCSDKGIWKVECLYDPCFPDPDAASCVCQEYDGDENCPASKPTHGAACDVFQCQFACEYFGDPCGEDIGAGCYDGTWDVDPPECR
jgi:hypothetical protein